MCIYNTSFSPPHSSINWSSIFLSHAPFSALVNSLHLCAPQLPLLGPCNWPSHLPSVCTVSPIRHSESEEWLLFQLLPGAEKEQWPPSHFRSPPSQCTPTEGAIQDAHPSPGTVSLDYRDWMAALDLHIPVLQAHRRYLQFMVGLGHFQFTISPFGLTIAQHCSQK